MDFTSPSYSYRVCIVVVSYDHHATLEACLDSISKSTCASDAIYVVENFHPISQNIRTLSEKHSQANWKFNTKNLGFTGGNHQGINWALENGFQYILLLNPDTIINKDTIDSLLAASRNKRDEWILGPLLVKRSESGETIIDSAGLKLDGYYRATDIDQGKALCDYNQKDPIKKVPALCGAAMFIPTALFPIRDDGNLFFDESYFAYYEDVEFGFFWKKEGGKLGIVNDVKIIHQRGGKSGLKGIKWKRWNSEEREVIKKMIINRYVTIGRYISKNEIMKALPRFGSYELLRWLYISFRKPYLLTLFGQCLSHIYQILKRKSNKAIS